MMKKISNVFYFFINLFDHLIFFFFKKNIKFYLYDLLRENYSTINLKKKKIIFFTPSSISNWRVKTIFQKEPETIKFINNLTDGSIFFDIGANIGIYSVYAAIKKPNLKIFAFEPSTSNLSILSRNIYLNKLQEKISIVQLPLGVKDLNIDLIGESFFEEGGSMSSFATNLGFDGKRLKAINKYKIIGTSLDFLIKNKVIPQPNAIKLDVDGVEHLILEGGLKCLRNKKLKKIIVEINENFKFQKSNILRTLTKNNFLLLEKTRAEEFYNSKKFDKTYNYIFEKKF